MKIGYIEENYPEKRCIINKTGNLEYRLVTTRAQRLIRKARYRLGGHDWNVRNFYRPRKEPEADVLHTFNHVCQISGKWCVTFESTVPRNNFTVNRPWETGKSVSADALTKRQLSLLAQPNCLALIALSGSAIRIQENMLDKLGSEKTDVLRKKLLVLHPPQKALVTREELEARFKQNNERMELIFIGNYFFGKGGMQMIAVLREFADRYPFRLTVVSRLDYGDFAGDASKKDREECIRLMDSLPWIPCHGSPGTTAWKTAN